MPGHRTKPLPGGSTKGLRQFLDRAQQQRWMEGEALPARCCRTLGSARTAVQICSRRFEKLLQRPQAEDVLDILKTYAETCIPIPRTTERFYWSVSCLPGSPDKPLARVNASWMELFTLHAEARDLRARFILHLSDFTTDGSPEPDHLDRALLESCVERPKDVSHFLWKADTFGVKVRGAASIRAFLSHPHALTRHPPLQPHPHEPRPQRLPGEPLLQPRRLSCWNRRPGLDQGPG